MKDFPCFFTLKCSIRKHLYRSLVLGFTAASLPLYLAAQSPDSISERGRPLATVAGSTIYEDELPSSVQGQCQSLRRQEFELKRKALDQLVRQQLLEAEASLTISGDRDGAEAAYFKQADVQRIIATAKEPYRTMFVLASQTGLRAGELLGLTVADIDFDRLLICPRKQADDRTRVLRELKTKRSRTPVPITQQTAAILRDYMK